MPFQLVLATDNQITVWHTDHGHIFVYNLDSKAERLVAFWSRDVPEAPVRAEALAEQAQLFAEGEARSRRMVR